MVEREKRKKRERKREKKMREKREKEKGERGLPHIVTERRGAWDWVWDNGGWGGKEIKHAQSLASAQSHAMPRGSKRCV